MKLSCISFELVFIFVSWRHRISSLYLFIICINLSRLECEANPLQFKLATFISLIPEGAKQTSWYSESARVPSLDPGAGREVCLCELLTSAALWLRVISTGSWALCWDTCLANASACVLIFLYVWRCLLLFSARLAVRLIKAVGERHFLFKGRFCWVWLVGLGFGRLIPLSACLQQAARLSRNAKGGPTIAVCGEVGVSWISEKAWVWRDRWW